MASLRSYVWNVMEKTSPDAVKCLLCSRTFNIKYAGGSTSNLRRHIKIVHPQYEASVPFKDKNAPTSNVKPIFSRPGSSGDEKPSLCEPGQPPIATTNWRNTKYRADSYRKKELDGHVLDMVTTDLQPFSVVEDPAFSKLIKSLDPRYELPSQQQLSHELLPKAYTKEKEALRIRLRGIDHVSVTTDIWTSRQAQVYMTVTANFLSSSWELQSAVLGTPRLPPDHTAVNIALVLGELFELWEITDKVTSVVTDNTINMVTAVTQELKFCHVPCLAHTLDSIVTHALSGDVMYVIERVRAIVSYFQHNAKGADKLRNMQLASGRPGKILAKDVETRWNSTVKLLRGYLEEHQAITSTLCMLSRSDLCVSDEQVVMMKTTVEALEPFELATEEMSATKRTSLSKMLPIVRLLSECLSEVPSSTLRNELQAQVRQQSKALEETFIIGASTLLDPRFKRLPFSNQASLKETEDRLASMLHALYVEEERQSTVDEMLESSTDESEPPRKKSLWDIFDTKVKQLQPNLETQRKKKSLWDKFDSKVKDMLESAAATPTDSFVELQRYFDGQILRRDNNFDPLGWWKENELFYPRLSKLARQFLYIPATSVPSDRLFSKAGDVVAARRSCLKDSTIDMVLFLNKSM